MLPLSDYSVTSVGPSQSNLRPTQNKPSNGLGLASRVRVPKGEAYAQQCGSGPLALPYFRFGDLVHGGGCESGAL